VNFYAILFYFVDYGIPVEQQTRKNSNFPVRGIFKNPFSLHRNFILSDAKSVNIRDKKKHTIFRGKEKKRYFYIQRRPILYQIENHDH
jgi:hypothetical protein